MDDVTLENIAKLTDQEIDNLARPTLIRALRVLWGHNNDDPAALRSMIMQENSVLVAELKNRVSSLRGGKPHTQPVDMQPALPPVPVTPPPAMTVEEPPPPPEPEAAPRKGRGKAAASAATTSAAPSADVSALMEKVSGIDIAVTKTIAAVVDVKGELAVLAVNHAAGVKDLQQAQAQHGKQLLAAMATTCQLLTGTPPEEFKSLVSETFKKLYPNG